MAERVTSFVAECYWPDVREEEVRTLDERIAASLDDDVRYLGSVLIHKDEVVLCQFEGTADAIRRVAKQAVRMYERLLAATVSLHPDRPVQELSMTYVQPLPQDYAVAARSMDRCPSRCRVQQDPALAAASASVSHHAPTRSRGSPASRPATAAGAVSGQFTIHWKQSGSLLHGTIKLSNPNGKYGISGSIKKGKIKFGAVSVGAKYKGKLKSTSMSGTWTSPSGGGSWNATKSS